MADLLFIGMMFAFFAMAVGLVRVCDRIIGVDDEVIIGPDEDVDATDTGEAEVVAA
jgi:hypothetical protein